MSESIARVSYEERVIQDIETIVVYLFIMWIFRVESLSPSPFGFRFLTIPARLQIFRAFDDLPNTYKLHPFMCIILLEPGFASIQTLAWFNQPFSLILPPMNKLILPIFLRITFWCDVRDSIIAKRNYSK